MATISPINIGDVLPSLTLKNEKGDDVEIASLAADKGVVIFAVPKADTRSCRTFTLPILDAYNAVIRACSRLHDASLRVPRQLSRLLAVRV
jgi:peroxiredoxin